MSCDYKCSVALPRGAVSWSAVCDYGISWSYSFCLHLRRCFSTSMAVAVQVNLYNEHIITMQLPA